MSLPKTYLVSALVLTGICGQASAVMIYSNEMWEGQSLGELPTTSNDTDYVNTADGTSRIRVSANLDDGDAGTVDPTGQHGLIQGNINKHATQTNPMTLLADGVSSLEIEFAILFNKGSYSLGNNAFELVYSALGDFTDTVVVQRFTTVDAGADEPYEYDQLLWYTGQSVTIDSTDDGITFTDTAKIRWRKGAGSNGQNSSVYLDDVVVTGITTSLSGDFDGDGDVDGVDIAQLFGAFTGPLTPASVPEPAGLAVFALAGLLYMPRRRSDL